MSIEFEQCVAFRFMCFSARNDYQSIHTFGKLIYIVFRGHLSLNPYLEVCPREWHCTVQRVSAQY